MSNNIEISRPLGPLLGKVRLSEELVNFLNSHVSGELEDYSDSLVGKVKQELKFTDEISQRVINELASAIAEYHMNFVPSDRAEGIGIQVNVLSGWFVRQFQHDYNPLHLHTNCSLSCVGYLSLPENIEMEWEEDEKDHHPANGRIEFAYGTATQTYTNATIRIKPVVGDFFIFPAGLWHTVYPFKTKGERRSFSMNLSITKTDLTAKED